MSKKMMVRTASRVGIPSSSRLTMNLSMRRVVPWAERQKGGRQVTPIGATCRSQACRFEALASRTELRGDRGCFVIARIQLRNRDQLVPVVDVRLPSIDLVRV